MINTVIFDMDGVIIDSEPIHMEIQHLLFSEYNISLTNAEYESYIGRSSKNMWQELIQKHSLAVTVEEILALDKSKYHKKLRELSGLQPIPGVTALIEALHHKGVKLVLASSSSHESINLVLELFQLDVYFQRRISGAELKWSKPNPEIFLEAAKMVSSVPQECLVIEDSKHGVSAAKSANMFCIGFQNANSGSQDLSAADLIVTHFNDLSESIVLELDRKHLG